MVQPPYVIAESGWKRAPPHRRFAQHAFAHASEVAVELSCTRSWPGESRLLPSSFGVQTPCGRNGNVGGGGFGMCHARGARDGDESSCDILWCSDRGDAVCCGWDAARSYLGAHDFSLLLRHVTERGSRANGRETDRAR